MFKYIAMSIIIVLKGEEILRNGAVRGFLICLQHKYNI